MLNTLRKRLERDEDGFTLIELMVVVLIIAILLAIAIPTFLGARERANNRAAQSSLRNSLTAAKTIFTDAQDYTQATASKLNEVEPAISHVASATLSTSHKTVSVNGSAANTWYGAALSKSNVCFMIKDLTASGGGTTYHKVTSDSTGTGCSGAAALAADASFSATGWD